MKKVLFIIDSLGCGGAEKSLISLLPLLDRNKYKLYLWIRTRGGVFESYLPDDVEIVSPSCNRVQRTLWKIGQLLFSVALRFNKLFRIKRHGAELLWKCAGWGVTIPEGHWDVVVAYQQGFPTYVVANKFVNCNKIAWINVNVFSGGYDIKFNCRYYDKIDHIVVVSAMLEDLLRKGMPQFAHKYSIIYDIINPNTIKRLALEKFNSIKSSQGELVLVTTARLVPQKGYDLAVEAAKELKQLGIKFKWYFIGEGSERVKIEKMISEDNLHKEVVLLGLQANPYPFMKQADIYVQTSRFEGFGLTIAEAKILGKPVVSTNFDVIRNQIQNEVNGLVVEMDGKSIAKAIVRLATDSKLRNKIIENVTKENNTTYISEVKKVEQLFDLSLNEN